MRGKTAEERGGRDGENAGERDREKKREIKRIYIFSISFFCIFNDFRFLKYSQKILRNLEKILIYS